MNLRTITNIKRMRFTCTNWILSALSYAIFALRLYQLLNQTPKVSKTKLIPHC